MKILLITPPYHCGVLESAGKWPHLGYIYMAGALRDTGHKVKIYDAMSLNHNYEDIKKELIKEAPDIVCTSAYTATYNDAIKVLKLAKDIKSSVKTVMGGVHPTFMYEETFRNNQGIVDYIIRGEGEFTVTELIKALDIGSSLEDIAGLVYRDNGELIVNPERCFIEDLDSLKPAWDLVDWDVYTYYVYPQSRMTTVNFSRGCTQECSFCSQQKFWKKIWRGRDPKKFADELEYLNSKYKINVALITDEWPTQDREKWEELLDILIRKELDLYLLMETRVEDIVRDADIIHKYRQAGIVHIYVGVEATNQTTLDRFKKNLKVQESLEAIKLLDKAEIISETSFVLGLPEETPETIKKTLELAKYYDPDFAHFLLISPWPYADIYQELKPYIEDNDYSKYNLVEPIIRSEKLSRKELFDQVISCYMKYYMSKMPKWLKMKDGFKKDYMLKSMKLIMNNSFIKEHVKGYDEIKLKMGQQMTKMTL